MSSLGFLQADVESSGPPARSPIADDAEAAGARMHARDGWTVALDYGDPEAERAAIGKAVAFVDLSHLGVLELQGGEQALDLVEELPASPRGRAEDPLAARERDAWWCRVAPKRALVICEAHVTPALREELDGRASSALVDVTNSYGKLVLAGPEARETIARFCALDLRPHVMPVGAFRPGSVARTPGAVLCEAPERYLMLFGSAYGSFMWTIVADAASQLGGRPAGVDALAAAAPVGAPASGASEVGAHA